MGVISIGLPFVASLLVLSCMAAPGKAPEQTEESMNRNDDEDVVKFRSTVDLERQWKEYKIEHGKIYATASEDETRRQLFAESLQKVEAHNKLYDQGLTTYRKGINQFSDRTKSEKLQMKCVSPTNFSRMASDSFFKTQVPEKLPDSVDWRAIGAVRRVKDQNPCGSCWAFAAVAALEAQVYLKTGQEVELSEQNLVDCVPEEAPYSCFGCEGGMPHRAYQYIKDVGGIDTEASYTYEAAVGDCRYKQGVRGAQVSDFGVVSGSEYNMQMVLALFGPVAVAIDVSDDFDAYDSGVFVDNKCSNSPNDMKHAVTVVGYRSAGPGRDYWIVKNSWGRKWGMDGYILMSRNKDNQCGIANIAALPVI